MKKFLITIVTALILASCSADAGDYPPTPNPVLSVRVGKISVELVSSDPRSIAIFDLRFNGGTCKAIPFAPVDFNHLPPSTRLDQPLPPRQPLNYPIILKSGDAIEIGLDLNTVGCINGVKTLDVETAHKTVTTFQIPRS